MGGAAAVAPALRKLTSCAASRCCLRAGLGKGHSQRSRLRLPRRDPFVPFPVSKTNWDSLLLLRHFLAQPFAHLPSPAIPPASVYQPLITCWQNLAFCPNIKRGNLG